jgi:ADP-ribose pyrophosphatase YjhB (NUDIX family)
MPKIRPIAICIIQHAGKILVFRGWDDCDQSTFFRPLGGGIEFGETGTQAIHRELDEEIGAQLTDVRYLFTLENIFTCNGEAGHEIVLVFEAALVDLDLYAREEITGCEANGMPLHVCWKALNDFASGKEILVPEGLLPRLLE